MELYKHIDELKEESAVEVAVSYLEVYNETIIDLINPETGQLAIRDDGKSAINITGNCVKDTTIKYIQIDKIFIVGKLYYNED